MLVFLIKIILGVGCLSQGLKTKTAFLASLVVAAVMAAAIAFLGVNYIIGVIITVILAILIAIGDDTILA